MAKSVCFMAGVLLLEVCVVKMLSAQQYYGFPEAWYGVRARREQLPFRTREDVDRLSEILLNNASDEEKPRYKDIARLLRVGRSVDMNSNNERRLKRSADGMPQQTAADADPAPLPHHPRSSRSAASSANRDSFFSHDNALNRDIVHFRNGV